MSVVTSSGLQPAGIAFNTAGAQGRIYAPGLQLRIDVRPPSPPSPTTFAASPAGHAPAIPLLDAALHAEGFQHFLEMEVQDVMLVPGVAALHFPGIAASVVEVEIETAADEVALAMILTDGIVQWALPVPEAPAPTPTNSTATTARRFAVPVEPRRVAPGLFHVGPANVVGVARKVIRFLKSKSDAAISAVVGAVATPVLRAVECKLKNEGFVRFAPQGEPDRLEPVDWANLKHHRALLLVHGVFDSIAGNFDPLDGADGLHGALWHGYSGRVIGFDHWTVAKTPLENAIDLVNAIPADAALELDLLCHSRGALVVRSLLEHPAVQPLLAGRVGRIGKAIFLGGANQGSDLAATENWLRLINTFSWLGSIPIGPGWLDTTIKVIIGVLKVLAHGITRIPAIEALAPDTAEKPNQLLRDLNAATMTAAERIITVRANFARAKSLLLIPADLGSDFLFRGKPNDLVVPFRGAAEFDPWVNAQVPVLDLSFGTETDGQSDVWHNTILLDARVRQLIREQLL